MSADLEQRALRLFAANHEDADPQILADYWDSDPELRAFWLRQVLTVLGVDE